MVDTGLAFCYSDLMKKLLTITFITVMLFTLFGTPASKAEARHWQYSNASAFGSGLFGNRTACGQTLRRGTVGIAHKKFRCGTKVRICQRRKCHTLRVIDRGPFVRNREFDLTLAAVKLYGVRSERAWGVRRVRWKRVR